MAADDIFQIIDQQTFQGQKVLNVYFYQAGAGVGSGYDAEDVYTAWSNDVLPSIRAAQTSSITHSACTVQNLFNPSDKFVITTALNGTRANVNMTPTFLAVMFSLSQANGAIRNGRKAISGLDANDLVNGVITASAAVTALGNLATAMETVIGLGSDLGLTPVVVKRILTGGVYRLPTTLAEAVIGKVIDVVWNNLASHQDSRQIGRGA